MRISSIASIQRPISMVLLIPLMLLLIDAEAFSQEKRAQEGKIENARWIVEAGVAVITFELVAPVEKEYEITVTLRRASDKNFVLIPRSLAGAVGIGKFAGQREIRWDFSKDAPAGLAGDDYWFEITASEVVEKSSSFWYYAASAGVALATGAAYLLAKKGNGAAAPQPSGLPDPPKIRPTQ